jgi:predicted membrane protein
MKDVTNRPPGTIRELRLFATISAISIGAIAGVVIPALRRRDFPLWPWAIAAVLLLLAVFAPRSLRGFHSLARRVGDRVAAIQSFVVLTIVYFVVIVPLGLLFQLSQRLRRGQRSVATYRVPAVARPKSSLEKPF